MTVARGIAFSGKQRAGKDYYASGVARALASMGYQVHRVSWADPLKEEVAFAFGIDRAMLDEMKNGDHGAEVASLVRGELQRVGIEKREQDEDHWVKLGLASVPPGFIAVNADTRFPNEARRASEAGWIVVRVECPREVRAARGTLTNESHASETALDGMADFDLFVDGRDALDDVVARVLKASGFT